MKYILSFLLVAFMVLGTIAQDLTRTKTLSRNESRQEYSYYSFPMSTSRDYIAVDHDELVYEININKHSPAEVQWYLAIDTIGAPDSMNVDIDLDFQVYEAEGYTTLKLTAWDGDNDGDLAAAIRDSSHIGVQILPLNAPVFARQSRLSMTPTTGAGVGVVGDRANIIAVIAKVHVIQ